MSYFGTAEYLAFQKDSFRSEIMPFLTAQAKRLSFIIATCRQLASKTEDARLCVHDLHSELGYNIALLHSLGITEVSGDAPSDQIAAEVESILAAIGKNVKLAVNPLMDTAHLQASSKDILLMLAPNAVVSEKLLEAMLENCFKALRENGVLVLQLWSSNSARFPPPTHLSPNSFYRLQVKSAGKYLAEEILSHYVVNDGILTVNTFRDNFLSANDPYYLESIIRRHRYSKVEFYPADKRGRKTFIFIKK